MSYYYRNDPRWITAKFNSLCAGCGSQIKRGDDIFYYPTGKKALCSVCGETQSNQFEAAAADEAFINSQF